MIRDNRQGEHVLICDSDLTFSENCKLVLSAWRYQAVSITDCTQILNVLEHDPVDVILLDMQFFDTSTLVLVKLLKTFYRTRNVPIIVLSFETSNKEKLEKAGADGFLKRPVDWQELKALLREVLDKSNKAA